MIKKIVMGKEYQTKSERLVRILCTDLKGDTTHTVVYALLRKDSVGEEYETVETCNAEGFFNNEKDPHPLDLVPVPVKKTGWMNIYYGDVVSNIYPTKEEAKRNTLDERADCRQVWWYE